MAEIAKIKDFNGEISVYWYLDSLMIEQGQDLIGIERESLPELIELLQKELVAGKEKMK